MHKQILDFWFEEIDPSKWWVKDLDFDALIESRFGDLHEQACRGELFHWRNTAQGRLAEIIILDQFSRNIYRDRPKAFATDAMALTLAQEAISHGCEQELTDIQKPFLYLPYMHSESLIIHDEAKKLYAALGNPMSIEFEQKHRDIIEKFGRYPHRNITLGRQSSKEELAFLNTPGSSF